MNRLKEKANFARARKAERLQKLREEVSKHDTYDSLEAAVASTGLTGLQKLSQVDYMSYRKGHRYESDTKRVYVIEVYELGLFYVDSVRDILHKNNMYFQR